MSTGRYPTLGRRAVLGSLLASGLAACASQEPSPAPKPGPELPPPVDEVSPSTKARRSQEPLLESRFREVARFHPVEIMAPAFVLAKAVHAGEVDEERRYPAAIPAPFVAVEVDVLAARGDGVVTAGLVSADASTALRARVTPDSGAVEIELTAGGRGTVVRRGRADVGNGAFALGFVLCENQATVLVRPSGGEWLAVLTERSAVAARVDFTEPAVLAQMQFAWGVQNGSCHLGEGRAGLFGMTGLRDPHLVQNADGTPYERDGRLFLTWTCAGLGFFRQAHWGVFELDPSHPERMRQVSHIYVHRDGRVVGDHAGQLVRDGDRWLFANSSWGDFDGSGVHVRHGVSGEDLLTGVHVVATEPTRLPTSLDSWDPGFTRIDGRWHVTYVESRSQSPFVFHPALARAAGADPFAGLTRLGADDDRSQTEGPILARNGKRWLVLASDGDRRRYPVYDLRMREIGELDAPYGSNIPHPQVIEHDGRRLMLTFDDRALFKDVVGYGGHGDVIVLTSQ